MHFSGYYSFMGSSNNFTVMMTWSLMTCQMIRKSQILKFQSTSGIAWKVKKIVSFALLLFCFFVLLFYMLNVVGFVCFRFFFSKFVLFCPVLLLFFLCFVCCLNFPLKFVYCLVFVV